MSKMIPPVGVAMACGRTRAWEKKMHVNAHKGNKIEHQFISFINNNDI